MKLLVLASALDLTLKLSSTPHWWQLLGALAAEGVELTVAPYHGPPVESLHWRAAENPCLYEGRAFGLASGLAAKLGLSAGGRTARGETAGDRAVRALASSWIAPRWTAHVHALFRESGFDAVVLLNVPLNHVVGLAASVRARHHVPVWYYDGDLPSSLPEFGGFASSFRFYDGADLTEFDGFFANSVGAAPLLTARGARAVEVVHWAADPDVYRPREATQDLDTFFHGYGEVYRREWLEAMVYEPSRRRPDRSFALGGARFDTAPPSVVSLGDVPFAHYGAAAARARVNLIVTRTTHADLEGTSSARPFELGAMGAAAVSNPWKGLERWFEPGSEVFIVHSTDEALAVYDELWKHPELARETGRRMRERVLAEHTYRHRARQMLKRLAG